MISNTIKYEFVDAIPERLEERTLYVAIDFATAAHKCYCGCGQEVVTPLSPTDWKITYDGVSVSLSPSIGNWSFPCQSHYWIKRNAVKWAGQMTPEQIEAGRAADRHAKQSCYGPKGQSSQPHARETEPGFLARVWRWLSGS
ncbi:DUF6527 family protein [Pyruvatibacter mobilis]|uniref:DUF6527 family protein n=1 Tax=Pyruvatibacter mobilis TaxID=1712261 RepID=UPI003BACC880